jgi:IS30 family transposase
MNIKKLTREERILLYKCRRLGFGVRAIARELNRSPSTISRELRRNGDIVDRNQDYLSQAHAAHTASHERRVEASNTKIRLKCVEIQEFVEYWLKRKLSPELIAGRLTVLHPELSISDEAIYQWILHEREDLKDYLLVAGSNRRRKRGKKRRRFKQAAATKVSIEKRPEVANTRSRIGDFEIDSVVSSKSKPALMTVVDRKTRKVFIEKVNSLESEHFSDILIARFEKSVPEAHRHTITQDNGPENSAHKKIDAALGTQSYFCHPYCSAERGSVENRNGVIRWFFPKGTDFEEIPDEYIQYVEDFINDRPMTCLSFHTPNEAWEAEVRKKAA